MMTSSNQTNHVGQWKQLKRYRQLLRAVNDFEDEFFDNLLLLDFESNILLRHSIKFSFDYRFFSCGKFFGKNKMAVDSFFGGRILDAILFGFLQIQKNSSTKSIKQPLGIHSNRFYNSCAFKTHKKNS